MLRVAALRFQAQVWTSKIPAALLSTMHTEHANTLVPVLSSPPPVHADVTFLLPLLLLLLLLLPLLS